MLDAISTMIGAIVLFIGQILLSLFPFLPASIGTNPEQLMLIIGFAGQGLFAMRFIIQWQNPKARAVIIPLAFGISRLAADWCCFYMRSGGKIR